MNYDRRTFVLVAGGAVASLAGCTGGSDDGRTDDGSTDDRPGFVDDEPEYDDWFDDVPNFDGTRDFTGHDEVVVDVGTEGGLRYTPPAIRIDVGTTVRWEWTGRGGTHDVAEENGVFESRRSADAGFLYNVTFDDPGVYRYVCTPHRRQGMKGAVEVV